MDLKEIEKNYIIHESGEIYSIRHKKIMKSFLDRSGYYRIELNGKKYLLHRLLAAKYVTNPHNKQYVNHKNGVKTDNRIDNLEWVTSGENQRLTYELGLKSKTPKNANWCSLVVHQYYPNGAYKDEFPSIHEAERQTGVKAANIWKAIKGRRKTAGGYIWDTKSPYDFQFSPLDPLTTLIFW